MAAQEQRLLHGRLRAEMRLLDHPVFVRLARLDPGRAQSVMIQHAAEALRELPPAAPLELMRRGRQIVVPDHRGDRAQRPQRALQPRDERFKGLARRQRDVGPATEAEHAFEQEVRERVALDRDAQPAGIRKVEGALAAGHGGLLKVHLEVRAMLRAPVPHPPL
jgi:hypothetical protein